MHWAAASGSSGEGDIHPFPQVGKVACNGATRFYGSPDTESRASVLGHKTRHRAQDSVDFSSTGPTILLPGSCPLHAFTLSPPWNAPASLQTPTYLSTARRFRRPLSSGAVLPPALAQHHLVLGYLQCSANVKGSPMCFKVHLGQCAPAVSRHTLFRIGL